MYKPEAQKQAEELLGNMDLLPQHGPLILHNLPENVALTTLPKLLHEAVVAPNLCIPRQTHRAARLRLGLCLTPACRLRFGLCFGGKLRKGLGSGLCFTLASGLLDRCSIAGLSFPFLGLQIGLGSLPCNSQRALAQALSLRLLAGLLLGVG